MTLTELYNRINEIEKSILSLEQEKRAIRMEIQSIKSFNRVRMETERKQGKKKLLSMED